MFSPVLLVVAALIGPAGTAGAQEIAPIPTPLHLAVVDGQATLEREGRAEAAAASIPLEPGDRLRTDSGRVEIIAADGTALHLDHFTTLDIQSDTLFRLLEGRISLLVAAPPEGQRALGYRVDARAGSVHIDAPGEYRVSAYAGSLGDEIDLAVLRGWAELSGERASMMVRSGERSAIRGRSDPDPPVQFNSARWDAFDQWVAARRDAYVGTTSARYLPSDVRTYAGVFDRHGRWSHHPSYGYVWYPHASAGWRPYYNGYWLHRPRFGTVWIGWDAWGWPTHHFGRWGISTAGAWFWIPRRHWAGAWVSWAIAPGFVSWCPLGFDGGPVFALSVGTGFYASRGRFLARGVYDPWSAWTVVSVDHFVRRAHVPTHVVHVDRLDARTRGSFVADRGPAIEALVRQPAASRGLADATPRQAVPRAGVTAGTRAAPAVDGSPDVFRGSRDDVVRGRARSADAGAGRPGADARRAIPRGGFDAPVAPRGRVESPRAESPYDRAAREAEAWRSPSRAPVNRVPPAGAATEPPPQDRTPARRAIPRASPERSSPPAYSRPSDPDGGAPFRARPPAPPARSAPPPSRGIGGEPSAPRGDRAAPRAPERGPGAAPPPRSYERPSSSPHSRPADPGRRAVPRGSSRPPGPAPASRSSLSGRPGARPSPSAARAGRVPARAAPARSAGDSAERRVVRRRGPG